MYERLTVTGLDVDPETRCRHYHSANDRIAIRFHCCNRYFPCFECHQALGCGHHSVWPKEQFNERAILCGACSTELSIREYLNCASHCPNCSADFNPGCSLHKHLYFET